MKREIKPGPAETGTFCSGCGGALVSHTTHEYRGDPMHRVYGPGGSHQMSATTNTWCSKCGAHYMNGGGLKEPQKKE